MRYPNLFLAGAPKCGTTSLAYYLGQHPDIFAPLVKEPVFFGSDLSSLGTRLPQSEYFGYYEKWSDERYALDASPQYFFSRKAATEIFAQSSDAAILFMVRNPIDAAHSMYHQLRYNGTEHLGTFEASLDAEQERVRNPVTPKFGYFENFLYSRIFSFTENIKKFENTFGEDRVRTIFLEDLKRDPALVVREVCSFLLIDGTLADRFDFETKNSAKRVRSRWLNTLANYPPAWAGHLTKPLLSRDVRTRIRQFISEKNARAAVNPPMNPETRSRLAEHFKPEIEKLSQHFDRDLTHWLRNDG